MVVINLFNITKKETKIESVPEECVYASIDGIGVKHQKDSRKESSARDYKYVENTVAHIQSVFQFHPYTVILDWFHLKKRCQEWLSTAIRGKDRRNAILEKAPRCLWVGDALTCYALRARLGLRNSSNPVEKTNDLIVAGRQKHNGMA